MLMSTVPDLFEKLSVLLTTLTLVPRVRVESASPLSRLSGRSAPLCDGGRRLMRPRSPCRCSWLGSYFVSARTNQDIIIVVVVVGYAGRWRAPAGPMQFLHWLPPGRGNHG